MKSILTLLVSFFIIVTLQAQTKQASISPLDLMPMPKDISIHNDKFRLDKTFTVSINGEFHDRLLTGTTRFLRRLDGRTGIFFKQGYLTRLANNQSSPFQLVSKRKGEVRLHEDESYQLEITKDQIKLTAENDIGALRGLETLLQLLSADQDGYYFPTINIKDQPRFPWRGLMIDVARHFQPMDVIKRNLDAMAAVKMNVLHLHLTDDHGFRIESKVFPKLHQLGSDNQYFTQLQIKEIIAYADERGIRVVPEFDVPGHATSWICAYPELASSPHQYIEDQKAGKAIKPYHIERNSGIFDATLDPSKKSTYKFLKKLFDEMTALFPDPYFHIGGDENEGKQWDNSPEIQDFMKKNGLKDNHQLQTYFNRQLLKNLTKNGKKMMGWDEILQPELPKNSIIQSWQGKESMYKAAKQGYESVLSSGYYIDLMFPASQHYTNDPLDKADELTPEQQKRVLGGEATIWSELVTKHTIDSRVWPRTAAIAERLWSPASVNNVDDMYRRLDIISFRLEELGMQHIASRERILRNLANNQDVSPIRNLVEVIEPLKGWNNRNKGGDIYQTYSPYTLLADAAGADAKAARIFNKAVSRYVKDQNSSDQALITNYLNLWIANHQKIESLIIKSPVLAEARSISKQLEEAAKLTLEGLNKKDKLNKTWLQESTAKLTKARKPGAKTTLQVIDAMEALIQHCCGEKVNFNVKDGE